VKIRTQVHKTERNTCNKANWKSILIYVALNVQTTS